MTIVTYFAILVGGVLCVAFTLAAGLLVFGLRGRKTDDHPYCRACGFDLFGKPNESTVCSECGRDLSPRRAIRHGRREKRWVPISVGIVLLLILAASATTGVVGSRYVSDWNEHKPLWWLLADAEAADQTVHDAAQQTITQRQMLNKWSVAERRNIVDRALDRHADRSRTWNAFWGEAISWELILDRLPDDQWQRYVRQALPTTIEFHARASIERGKPLPFEFVSRGGRFDYSNADLELQGKSQDRTVWIDNLELKPNGGLIRLGTQEGGVSFITRAFDLSPLLSRLADGPHTLRVRQTFSITGGPGGPGTKVGTSKWKTTGERVEDHTASFEILPTGTSGLRPKRDDAVKAALEKYFVANYIYLYRKNPTVTMLERLSGGRLDVVFRGPVPPKTALAVSITPAVRYQGREWPLREFLWRPGEEFPRWDLTGLAGNLPTDAQRVDVVLRPNPKALEQTTDLFDYWDGEIVVRDLLVYEDRIPRDPALRRAQEERQAEVLRKTLAAKQAATQPATLPRDASPAKK